MPTKTDLKISEHATKLLCPNCTQTFAKHVHCAHLGCAYHITVCEQCDPRDAVLAFMADHQKDCEITQPFVRQEIAA